MKPATVQIFEWVGSIALIIGVVWLLVRWQYVRVRKRGWATVIRVEERQRASAIMVSLSGSAEGTDRILVGSANRQRLKVGDQLWVRFRKNDTRTCTQDRLPSLPWGPAVLLGTGLGCWVSLWLNLVFYS